MTKKEIEAKKAELRNKITEAKTTEELEELRKQAESLNKEVPEDDGEITPEEERKLIKDVDNLEKRKIEVTNIIKNKEERNLKEFTKFNVLKSDEYRSAWAKKLMCKPETDFTDDEIVQYRSEIVQIAYDIEWNNKFDIHLSPLVKNVDRFNYWLEALPFYMNVQKEGVVLSES